MAASAGGGIEAVREQVWQVLRTCYDPEIPVDIVELGLVYVCDVLPMDDGRFRVAIQMTLTAPGCGMGESIADEVCDKVLALPQVCRDDFFAAVRALYNARAEEDEVERLTFCLVGVALPSDLIADETRTPFNVGRAIPLQDFTRAEMAVMEGGLREASEQAARAADPAFVGFSSARGRAFYFEEHDTRSGKAAPAAWPVTPSPARAPSGAGCSGSRRSPRDARSPSR